MRARAQDALAGAVGDLDADEGAQRAVGGLRAGVEVDAGEAAEARHVVVAAVDRAEAVVADDRVAAGRERSRCVGAVCPAAALRSVAVFATRPAADPQAGVGARDVEEACPVGGADADVFDRSRLRHRKVGCLSHGHRGETRG